MLTGIGFGGVQEAEMGCVYTLATWCAYSTWYLRRIPCL